LHVQNLPAWNHFDFIHNRQPSRHHIHYSMGALESSEEIDDVADQIAEAFGAPRQPRETHSKMENLELLSEWIETGQAKRIIVLTGAGISTGMWWLRFLWMTSPAVSFTMF
jgi:hypothetical protein